MVNGNLLILPEGKAIKEGSQVKDSVTDFLKLEIGFYLLLVESVTGIL